MIRTTEDGPVRTVTVDRPARRNALHPDDLDALAAAVAEAETPVVHLRGAGSAFCAGADFDAVTALSDPAAFVRHGQRTMRAVAESDAVVVAGIDGPARGGGVELALACDLRIATPGATFGEPGVRFGLFGAWGGTVRLPRVVGPTDAADFALSGRVVDADEALRMGLVSRVVDDPRTVVEEVAANKPDAVRTVGELLRSDAAVAEREAAEAAAFERLVERYADEIADAR